MSTRTNRQGSLVGLGVLDSFAMGLPVATTAFPYHSPEIEYLDPGGNGTVTADWRSAGAYAADICGVLADPRRRAHLARNTAAVARAVTVEEMARRFAGGIEDALEHQRFRGRFR